MNISDFIASHILSLNYNFILGGCLIIIFASIWLRRSLAAIASLSMVATYYILSQGSSFINSWLMTSPHGIRNVQLTAAIRLAVVIVLPLFVLFVLKHLGRHQPMLVRILSAICFSGLLVWYVSLELSSNAMVSSLSSTPIYAKTDQFYPILLLAALVLSAAELWFIKKHDGAKSSKKAKA